MGKFIYWQLSFWVLFCVLATNCSHQEPEYSPEELKILEQAAKIHNKATKIYAELAPKKEQASAWITKLKAQKTTPAIEKTLQNLQNSLDNLTLWESEIVEVPNNEHEHEGHHHHHAPTPSVSAEDMLQIQTEMLDNLQEYSKKLEESLAEAQKLWETLPQN